MKTLIIAIAVIVGGVQIGGAAFDAVKSSAEKSQTAQLINERQSAL